jgi:hypothetical protein
MTEAEKAHMRDLDEQIWRVLVRAAAVRAFVNCEARSDLSYRGYEAEFDRLVHGGRIRGADGSLLVVQGVVR